MPSVLIVDDRPNVRTSIASALKGIDGAVTCSAETGADALRLVRIRSFDVVVAAASLTDDRGDDLQAALQDAQPHLPVIALTCDDCQSAEQSIAAGAVDFVTQSRLESELPAAAARAIRFRARRPSPPATSTYRIGGSVIARVPLAGDTAFAGIEEVLTTLADHDVFSTRHYTRYAIALASLAADLSDQRLAEKVDLFARWDRVGFAIGIALSNRESNARRAAISTPLRATLSARSQLVAQTAADRFDVNETTRTIRLSWLANPVNSSSASSVNAPPSEKAQHRRRVRSVGFQPTS